MANALGYFGHKAAIRRDQKLSGNDIFDKEIVEQLAKAAILVSVLSPAYVASEYCRKEIEEFYKAAEQNGKIKSVVVLEKELAAARSKTAGLRPIIWLPDGTEARGAQELQQFIVPSNEYRESHAKSAHCPGARYPSLKWARICAGVSVSFTVILRHLPS